MNSVALAFGGGAARSYCCIGVLKALENMPIRVNAFAGTSMGALIAALAAAGYSPTKIESIAKQARVLDMVSFSMQNIFDGLLSMGKLKIFLSKYLPATFEDLKYKLYITSVDIDSGEIVAFKSGNLLDALIASCSVPVLFKPVIINNRRLVDGGLKAQLPWEVLADNNHNNIVCVSCGYLAKKKPKYTNALNIAIRSIDILGHNMIKDAKLNNSIIVLEPDIEKYSIASFKLIDDIITAGELVVKQRINDIISIVSFPKIETC